MTLARADVARTVADPSRAADAAEAVNAFGLAMYGKLARQPGNLVISPASVAIALAMARAGARGTTADEMDTVLHGLGSDGMADAANALSAALSARTGSFPDTNGKLLPVTLRIANQLFAQRGMRLEDAFLAAMASRYDAGVRIVDYVGATEAARKAINTWVANATEQRIREILQPGDVDTLTRLALANAIYLKAPWLEPFAKDLTRDADFHLAGGATTQVPTMRLSEAFPYAAGDGWAAVQLPYVGNQLAMMVIVPDDLAAFESSLDATTLAAIVGALETKTVDLTLPRFDIESRVELGDLLAALGMPTAFNPDAADFSGITTQERLYISAVIHQANMTVDEEGTEAAAATVVVMRATALPGDRVSLHVDRPFLVVLRDIPTGAIVFLGRVADPTPSS